MVKKLSAAVLALLLGFVYLPRGAAHEPAKPPKDLSDFAETLLELTDVLHREYAVEVPRGQLIDWAVRGLYDGLDADLPRGVEASLPRIGTMKEKELRDLLREARTEADHVETISKLSNDIYLRFAVEGITRHLDDRTRLFYRLGRVYIGEEVPVGVGLKLEHEPESGLIRVRTPILGGPAYEAGVRAGDLITQITLLEDAYGDPLKEPRVIATKGLPLAAAIQHIEGHLHSRVRLTVQRPGMDRPRTFDLQRGRAAEEEVLGYRRKADDSWDYWIDADKKIGYVRLTGFRRFTAREFEQVLGALEKEHLAGLILDLRFNQGGYLDVMHDSAALFVEGQVCTIRERDGKEERFSCHRAGRSPLAYPMVCLVNRETAGGGDILSACLQDHHRALIVGERTTGGCGFLNTIRFRGTELRMMTGLFYRPNGKKLTRLNVPGSDADDWGVTPDPKYDSPLSFGERQELREHLERQTFLWPPDHKDKGPAFKDRQLDLALAYLRSLSDKR